MLGNTGLRGSSGALWWSLKWSLCWARGNKLVCSPKAANPFCRPLLPVIWSSRRGEKEAKKPNYTKAGREEVRGAYVEGGFLKKKNKTLNWRGMSCVTWFYRAFTFLWRVCTCKVNLPCAIYPCRERDRMETCVAPQLPHVDKRDGGKNPKLNFIFLWAVVFSRHFPPVHVLTMAVQPMYSCLHVSDFVSRLECLFLFYGVGSLLFANMFISEHSSLFVQCEHKTFYCNTFWVKKKKKPCLND